MQPYHVDHAGKKDLKQLMMCHEYLDVMEFQLSSP